MKRCLYCSKTFDSVKWQCPHCGWQPERNGDLFLFSPALSEHSGGFKASHFGPLATLEENFFWFRARNSLIIWALGKYGGGISSFIEIGCGTGFVLQGIARRFPKIHLVGSEIYSEGINYAVERIPGGNFLQMDARKIPFISEFDAIGAFDLIEHIEEDQTVLHQIYQALKPNGLMMLTVPQHRWLWSATDVNACHVRRYAVQELHDKVTLAGFTIVRSSSFVTILLPFMMISRLLQRRKRETVDPYAEFRISPMLNRLLEGLLCVERWLIRRGISLPVGGSRLIVATKIEKKNSTDGEVKHV